MKEYSANKKITTDKFGCGGHFFCGKWFDPKKIQDNPKTKKRNHDLVLLGLSVKPNLKGKLRLVHKIEIAQNSRKIFLSQNILDILG